MEDDTVPFLTALKMRSRNKTLGIYGSETHSPADHLKPQVVISTLSKQLRDMQKSDCLKKEGDTPSRKFIKSEFVHINVLFTQAVNHKKPTNNFETQCVSDTQLIDIVDSVEAMDNANNCMAHKFETNFNIANQNKIIEVSRALEQSIKNKCHEAKQKSNMCSNVNKNVQKAKQASEAKTEEEAVLKEFEYKKDIDYKYMDDINTDIYREFETSYSKTQNDCDTFSNMKENARLNILNKESLAHTTRETVTNTNNESEFKLKIGNVHNLNADGSGMDSNVHVKEIISMEHQQISDDQTRTNLEENNLKHSIGTFEEQTNTYSNDDIFIDNPNPETKKLNENRDMPSSPIFNNYKMRRKSEPSLVFPLHSFEKFESLVMPLIEKLDLDNARCSINSQIINKELVITADMVPILGAPHEKQFLEVHPSKSGHVDPSKEPTKLLNKFRANLKNGILFNTDEENNYVNHNFPYLSTLCRLETSLYKSEKLDKKKSIDLQTPSHKSVEDLEVSYIKAKGIVDNKKKQNNMLEEKSFKELAASYDSNNSNYYNSKLSNSSQNIVNVIKDENINRVTQNMLSKTKDNYMKPLKDTEFIGFRTANGKYINISEQALSNCKDIFKDIAMEDAGVNKKENTPCTVKEEFVEFKTASNKRINLSEEALAKTSNIFKDFDLDLKHQPTDIDFVVNRSGKGVTYKRDYTNVNDVADVVDYIDNNEHADKNEHLSIVDQTLLQEFENESIENESNIVPIFSHVEADTCSIMSVNKNYDPGIDKYGVYVNQFVPEPTSSNFIGFKTGRNKEITVTKEAFAQTRIFFQDIVFKDICTNDFKSNDNNIELSIKEDILKPTQINNNHGKDFGEESYKKGCNLDKKHAFDTVLAKTETASFSEPHEDKISADRESEKTFYPNIHNQRTDYTLCDHRHDYNKRVIVPGGVWNKNSSTIFQGFKTASNKVLIISDEALLKTRNIFQDIDSVSASKEDIQRIERSLNSKTKGDYHNIDFLNNSDVKINKENINVKHENRRYNNNLETASVFQGFKTASNKIVKVSEKAVLKSKDIFQSIDSKKVDSIPDDIIMNTKVGDDISSACQGFQSTKDRAMGISEKALLKTNGILESCSNNDKNDDYYSDIKQSGFQGFKTAANNEVKISKESLRKTKMIFQDIDDVGTGKDMLLIPAIMLKEPRINRYSEDKQIMKKSSLQGFKTASNKLVNISEDALVKTKNIFEDIGVHQDIIFSKPKNERDRPQGSVTEIQNRVTCDHREFKGFQTANNKSVKISDQAVSKSRKIFNDINSDIIINKNKFKEDVDTDNSINLINEMVGGILKEYRVPLVTGLQTDMNTNGNVSKISHQKSRKPCVDIGNKEQTSRDFEDSESDPKNVTLNVDSILNTQVINNFEESLYTEDFYKDTTPKQSRRSGSPILSCPKAKKRKKFETPYRSDSNIVKIPNIVANNKFITDCKYKFNVNYKKGKMYTLKDLHDMNTKSKCNKTVDGYILNFNFDTLLNFEFVGNRNDFTDVRWTMDKLKECFLQSVNKKIIPDGWLDNHLKLILWKLISYEIQFPNTMKGVCTVRNVLEQLKYRYDTELYNVQRPALRKLLEKDDVSTRTMVFAVVGLYEDGVKVNGSTNPLKTVELLLTDGWYCIMACTDKMISGLIHDGKILVGGKIATVGAELLNCEQGLSPWEDTSAIRLKIFGNSTRPAHWDARLGYHSNAVILSQLSTIAPHGGKVCKMRALVTRVYPALYVQRFQDGGTVTRSERLEHLYQMKYEAERQLQLEKLYEEVEKEFFEQELPDSEDQDTDIKRTAQGGSWKNRDLIEHQSLLTHSQVVNIQDNVLREKEKILEKLQKRVQEKIQEQGLNVNRNVVPLLKIRVAGFEERKGFVVTKAMISIWRPSDAILDVVKEGTWINMFNVVPTATRNSELQISAGRQSVFSRWHFKEKNEWKPYIQSLKRKCYTTKELVSFPSMTTDYNEIDTFGIVFLVEPSTKDFETAKGQFQNVFLTDTDKNFISIHFWGGIKKFGYDNIFDTGQIVACMNLQKRAGNTRKNIVQYRATELSIFTATPKLENVRKLTDELTKTFTSLDKGKFCEDCVLLKNDYTKMKQGTENISPYRFNTTDHNLTKNKLFIDSPIPQNKDVIFNLTGLDFESTFKQTETQQLSPNRLKRKRCVDEKIAKLKMYGEPPPLNKMYIINKSNKTGNAYKSPLTHVTGYVCSAARLKTVDDSPVTSNKLKDQLSPILSTNRGVVNRSGVNPVKLNFSPNNTANDKVETNPFEEEFECSPPLSLD